MEAVHLPQNCLMKREQEIARKGNEFGSVTGRPRRCGWFDAVAVRRTVQINFYLWLLYDRLDVLDGFLMS